MILRVVENDQGRRRVHPAGVAVLLAVCVVSCLLIPALGFWLVLGSAKLVTNALAIGFVNASTSFVVILIMQFRRPLKMLPRRPGDPDF